ncbi:MAG TPA: hypothetical protein VIT19_12295 [Pyrinomonadaceae bacterium]
MRKRVLLGLAVGLSCLFLLAGAAIEYGSRSVLAGYIATGRAEVAVEPVAEVNGFSVEVLIDGRRTNEYAARGRRYIEALERAEYELRIHNPTGTRVAVALAVDGMNTIDARHSSAWEARKWVIEPYGTIHVRGWQMSADNARRFYFTTERDSYGAKIGQTQNLGVISAVFFRERRPVTVMPVTPGGREERPTYKRGDADRTENSPAESSPSAGANRDAAKPRSTTPYPPPDDESAATGIGRNVQNGVTWIKMDLDQRPVAEVTIRYEYREALVRLGILPRGYPRPDVLNRRERAEGFDSKYCPQP